jgi:hypothetical protein
MRSAALGHGNQTKKEETMSRNVVIGVAVAAVVVVGVLFATGFWSADVTKDGALPDVDISATPGTMPEVDMDSKEVVIGTEKKTIDVPKVTTEEETVDVPVVGIKD